HAGFQDQDCQPGGAAEPRPARRAAEPLLCRKLPAKGTRLALQGKQDARIVEQQLGHGRAPDSSGRCIALARAVAFPLQFWRANTPPAGGMAEWPMALVLKTSNAQAFQGSNPCPSAHLP